MKYFSNMTIRTKLPLIIIVLSLFTGCLTALLSYHGAKQPLQVESETKLMALLDSRVVIVHEWLEALHSDIKVQSKNPTIHEAVVEFSEAWNELPGNKSSYLQEWYVQNNPNPTGSKENLDFAQDGTRYSMAHAKYHPYLRNYLRDLGFYDVFLFDTQGNLVYSVFKETDYATNFVSGQWSQTELGNAFRTARDASATGGEFFFDLKKYGPSHDAPASFLSAPLTDKNGVFLGVLAYQIPTKHLNEIMNDASGLGETGESFVVGHDHYLRSTSRFTQDDVVLEHENNTAPVLAALEGESGTMATVNDHDVPVISAYKPIDVMGVEWAIIVEQDSAELFAPIVSLRNKMIIQLAISMLVISILGIFFARGISNPLGLLAKSIKGIGEGDYKVEVPSTERKDEIGDMANSLLSLRDNLASATDALFKSSAFEGASIAMMMVDRKFTVTFVNESAQNLLSANADIYRTLWVSFDPENLVGTSIDTNSNDQLKKLPTDPSQLPFVTDLLVGKNYIRLSMAGIFDESGEWVGSTLEWSDVTRDCVNAGMLDALDKAQASIEFEIDGTIVTANENFLSTLGYTLEEIQGKHHSMFVEPKYKSSEKAEYEAFWAALGRGEFQTGEYKRIGKGGKEIWIQASYNPILDLNGKPVKVVKFATDVTAAKIQTADFEGQIEAIGRVQAVIEFNLDGTIIQANENFLATLGYTQNEIKGQHHSMFVTQEDAQSPEYRAFWEKLGRGEFVASKFKRIGKTGNVIWIQASYNPILDLNGNPIKVVKFATDITQAEEESRNNAGMLDALDKSQATIEFNLDGKIITANENFLSVLGYSLDQIKGKHHSMFVEKSFANSNDYRVFWDELREGKYQTGEFKRIGSDGGEIWIQAAYNPIVDENGKPVKVVKFASDITQVVNDRRRHEEEQKVQADALELVVSSLAVGLGKLSEGDFINRIDVEFADEYEALRNNFNDAASKLQELMEAQNLVVSSLADGLGKLAEGDLVNRIDVEFASDYEKLRHDFNDAVSKLQDTMSMIISTADGIRQGSSEISTATGDLSKRTESQAATLEETAAALDQITATVKQSAENATEANDVASKAQKEAQESGEVVRETVAAMDEIEKSATQISQIIGVIDDIAFQTNLLALNAGVEAARAGDAGRGFAVVAQEVRALAQRSSEAAKEIKGLITASSQHVGTGVELVGRAGKALEVIAERVDSINALVSNIAISSKEQSDSLAEANTAVNNMDQVTQQNASMVEETTAASHTLNGDANELMRQISHFNIGDGSPVSAKSPSTGASDNGQSVSEQQKRVATFATNGSAALKTNYESETEEWEDF